MSFEGEAYEFNLRLDLRFDDDDSNSCGQRR